MFFWSPNLVDFNFIGLSLSVANTSPDLGYLAAPRRLALTEHTRYCRCRCADSLSSSLQSVYNKLSLKKKTENLRITI